MLGYSNDVSLREEQRWFARLFVIGFFTALRQVEIKELTYDSFDHSKKTLHAMIFKKRGNATADDV